MPVALRPIQARMETRLEGDITLNRDPLPGEPLPLSILPPAKLGRVSPESPVAWSVYSGYRIEGETLVFVFAPEHFPHHDWNADPVCVAGEFNGWRPDIAWRLGETVERHRTRLVLRVPLSHIASLDPGFIDFKFVAISGHWFQPPDDAPNRVIDSNGRANRRVDPERSGAHVLRFSLAEIPGADAAIKLLWGGGEQTFAITAGPGGALLDLWTPAELGATVNGDATTTFRLFAPRARGVLLKTVSPDSRIITHTALHAVPDGVWEAVRPGNLHGWRYRYFVDGVNHDGSTDFLPTESVLDPYAKAAAGPAGPGIVIDERTLLSPEKPYRPPALTDLVIAEAHLRDLIALDPEFANKPRPGYRDLAAFIRKPDCPLRTLGINAIEFLPMQEFDKPGPGEQPPGFHWGYMPVNWFSPASLYGSSPEDATQVWEFRDLVAACHEAGLAVILDVVYNHTGSPNALLRLDKHHFFTEGADGELSNWSGCGNDFRADTPMGLRLITDSLKWLVQKYDVDGFRFDLAELLGVAVMRDIRRELEPVKENLIFIAEPWSFRGHIAGAMRGSGYASWNDGYRDFFAEWVRGARDTGALSHYLAGSPGNFALTPAGTLNYTESHDDRCWLDRITENPANDGTDPQPADIERTRLMFACLFSSLGVPMISAGQEFLRTKGGANNTYLRGDLSRLTQERLTRFADMRRYVKGWIALRRSEIGRVLRLGETPPAGFFRPYPSDCTDALALLYNAAHETKFGAPLIFAANPTGRTVDIPCDLGEIALFRLYADGERSGVTPLTETPTGAARIPGGLRLPPRSAALWSLL